jgi:hypothetical protein
MTGSDTEGACAGVTTTTVLGGGDALREHATDINTRTTIIANGTRIESTPVRMAGLCLRAESVAAAVKGRRLL